MIQSYMRPACNEPHKGVSGSEGVQKNICDTADQVCFENQKVLINEGTIQTIQKQNKSQAGCRETSSTG